VLDVALTAFANRGYEATSLDDLARDIGVTKQAILYHFPSKEVLLGAVVDDAASQLAATLGDSAQGCGLQRVDAVVRATFLVAARRPEVLGLVREVGRVGSTAVARMTEHLAPLAERADAFLVAEMRLGRLRTVDTGLLIATAYAAIVGVATETEVLRALHIEPDLRSLVRARRAVLDLLHRVLTPD
jgi:AcrR family transcriptional regulator